MKEDNDAERTREEGDNEIDLLEIALKLWSARKRLLIWAFWGAVAGLIIAFSIPKEYRSTVVLVPESEDTRGGGNLGALASFAGINFGSAAGEDALYPELYPNVVSSVPFTVELLDIELPADSKDGESYKLYDILKERTSSPWWNYIFGLPSKTLGAVRGLFSSNQNDGEGGINPFRLTADQNGVVKAANQRVWVDVDKKTSVITVNAKLQDPLAAASLADSVTERLKEYIVNYRTGKARHDLEYARKINDEARENYMEAQRKYASYADRNQGLASRMSAIELERLQNEATLAFNLYNSTSQQVQLADAKVQNNTPVFAVVEPATVPLIADEPRKGLIIMTFAILGLLAAAAYTIFAPGIVESIKEKRNQINS